MHLGTSSLTLTVGGVSRTADVSDCRIVSVRPDPATRRWGQERAYRLRGTAAQDPSVGSLWDLVWDHVGTRVEVVLRPAGGSVTSATRPTFTGTVTIEEPEGDLLGGAASTSTGNRFTFEIDWPFVGKPVRRTA